MGSPTVSYVILGEIERASGELKRSSSKALIFKLLYFGKEQCMLTRSLTGRFIWRVHSLFRTIRFGLKDLFFFFFEV